MPLSLGSLIEAVLLFVNALAILNEERFLRKVGWGYVQGEPLEDSVKGKIIHLLYSIRFLLRIPLIGVNLVYILYLLVLG
jgi:hypothetical protein